MTSPHLVELIDDDGTTYTNVLLAHGCRDACEDMEILIGGGNWNDVRINSVRAISHQEYRQFLKKVDGKRSKAS